MSSPTPTLSNPHDESVISPEREKNDEPDNVDFKESTVPPSRFWLLSVGICLGLFLSMLDTSIVATCLYEIGQEFHVQESLNWVALAYTLSYLGFALVFSRLSDIIGRREAFILACVLFFAFSLGCGFAQSINQLIILRALQAVGGSGLYSLTMIMLPEISPPHLKTQISTLIGLVVAISGVLGPVLGGILTKYLQWRWVFWINGPIGFVSMTLFFLTWPKREHLPTIERRSWRELDYLGSLLTIVSAGLVVFAFQEGSNNWDKAIFIAPLVVGLVCWILLFSWEYFVDRRRDRIAPAFPLHLFRNRAYTAGALNTMFLGFTYMMLIYAIPMRVQNIGDNSSLKAGLMLLPMLGGVAVGSALAGKINAVRNYAFETLLAGSSLMLIGCGLLTTLSNSLDSSKMMGFITFTGFGFGLTIATSTMMVNVEAPIRDYAPAQGILSQLRILGGSLGIATSSIHVNTYKHRLSIGDSLLQPGLKEAGFVYGNAFKDDVKIASYLTAVGVVVTLLAYRRQRRVIDEQRQELVEEETRRRRRVASEKQQTATDGLQ